MRSPLASSQRPNPLAVALAVATVVLGMALSTVGYRHFSEWRRGRQAGSQALGPEAVLEVFDLLDREYIRALDPRETLNAAIDGMRGSLEKGVTAFLPAIPRGADRRTCRAVFEEAFRQAVEAASGVVDSSELAYAALRGMVESVGDPYTAVFDPEQYRRLDEQMNGGNFGGVGIYIELDRVHSRRLTVVEPIAGTPAARAGLAPGDWIVSIDGEPTAGLDIETAASRIRGEVGSRVTLTIKRAGREPFEVALEREIIHVSSVVAKMLPDRLGYLRLRYFGSETRAEFEEAWKQVRERGVRGLVLDLRNNGGGYINASLDVCSHFLPRGQAVVSVVNPRISRHESHTSTGPGAPDLPLVVLVNRFSASASEITAGALKDHGVATLVGETTFGKASVQSIHILGDGGAVKYTVAHYLTPRGRDINEHGIEPDVPVEAEPTRHLGGPDDAQLQAAVALLERKLAQR